jgi:flagellar biosynthesis/type III secretory pathway protein FliH
MDIKKFIADLTARYRKLMEQSPRTSLAGAVADVNAAHEAGRKVGYETGHAEGYGAGREAGHEAGHAEGYEAGRKVGHTRQATLRGMREVERLDRRPAMQRATTKAIE